MKSLKDFEKELNKCSKCGLCQTACPIFKINQNECTVSKGKFIMLHGVTKGDLKLSKNINKYLDMCLKCGKCNEFCPSGIEVCKILNTAKFEYMKTTLSSKIINFLESRLIFTNFIKLVSKLSKNFRPAKKDVKNPKTTVVYFKGCVNQILPHTDIYLDKILKNSDIKIIEPEFECCGLPFLSDGNLKRFEQVAKHNMNLLNTNYDYLITDCASCESTILSYSNYIETPPLSVSKSINWGDLIAVKGIKFKFNKPVKITFHKPCHLKNDAFFKQILKNCENVEYIEMQDYDECCGFAGSFAVKNLKLSQQIAKNKAKNILKTDADYVITTCPGCIIGLKHGLFLSNNKKTKVVSLLEFLSKANSINC